MSRRRQSKKGTGRTKSSGGRQSGKAKTPQPQDQAKPIDSAAREQLIGDLAKFDDALAYEAERIKAAKLLGVRLSVIDRAVSKKRRALGLDADDDEGQGRAVKINDPLPWHEPVDGDRIATTLAAAVKTYLVVPDAAADAIAIWVLHTWCVNAFTMSPRLAITSPTRGCGKTTVLRLLNHIARRPKRSGSISPPAMFRMVEKFQPTMLLDETEKYIEHGGDLHALLNEGHCKGASVTRVLGEGLELREFAVFGAVAFARNGRVPDDLAQRSIVIEMQRRHAHEDLVRLRDDRAEALQQIARMCSRWADDNGHLLADQDPDMEVINRAGDNWLPLFAIADVIGADWPERIREAAATLVARESESIGPLLLADIKTILDEKQTDRTASEELCQMLTGIEGRPWADWKNGKPITPNQLARLLRPFNIVSDSVRIGTRTPKGYYLHQFAEAFDRYLGDTPPYRVQHRNNTSAAATSTHSQSATDDPGVAFQKWEKPASDGACCGVAPQKGGDPPNGEVAPSPPSQKTTDEDRSCRQCGGTLDGTEAAHIINGEWTWLHPECKPHYLRDHPAAISAADLSSQNRSAGGRS